MPDGDIYSQQWLIIRSLSRIAKKYNFVIYIKENAGFRDRFESSVVVPNSFYIVL